jgi:glycosyltransferase involved in cell wall biosynthesis
VRPAVVIGIPLYNGEEHIAEALESFLGQTYTDFAVVMVDDGSTDATAEIAARYVALDPRLTCERNPQRLGMTRNWRRVFDRACKLYGDFEYFAWGSDHDAWHPRWLACLVRELDGAPDSVLAYPLDVGISEGGVVIRKSWTFECRGERRRGARFRNTIFGMSAGNMVYGLYRAEFLQRCEVFRSVVLPDRLLLAELSLYGDFRQVDEVLWFRRYRDGVKASLARQRKTFFLDRVPKWTYLPWPLTHSVFLGRSLVVRGNGLPYISRFRGAGLTARHLWLASLFNLKTRWRKSKKKQHLKQTIRLSLRRVVPAPALARRVARHVTRFVHSTSQRA